MKGGWIKGFREVCRCASGTGVQMCLESYGFGARFSGNQMQGAKSIMVENKAESGKNAQKPYFERGI